MGETKEKVTLYSREGGADKQYTVWLEAKDGGWTVQFQFGPRGGWLQAGTKTKTPVGMDEARKIYDKILKDKRAKGYAQGEDAPAFSQTLDAVDAGVRPMLLTPDDEGNMERYLKDPAWGAQPKLNGKRIIVRVEGGKVEGINRRGLVCPIPMVLEKAFGRLANRHVLDGELVGETYNVFDLIDSSAFKEPASKACALRHEMATFVARTVESPHVVLVPFDREERVKRALVAALQANRREGVVFKRLDAPYAAGKVENLAKATAVKVKFYTEGSFLVLDWNKGTSSVQVAARDGKKTIPVGNVTVAAKYAEQVKKGDVVRVRYLYATAGDQLYQPCLDPDDAGSVVADGKVDAVGSLKHEGKDE